MSKRQEILARRKKEQLRNRLVIISLVVLGALVITFALVLPGIQTARHATQTQTAAIANVIQTPTVAFNTTVDGVHLGDPQARVQVTVYADFRCSGCAWYWANLEPKLISDYVETGKVYYTFRSYIVIDGYDNSGASLNAANAAMCAAEQNKFWDYHNTLYANQVSESADLYTNPRLVKMAENIGLDMTKFNACYDSRKYNPQVQQDVQEAVSLGLSATPSLLVNGTLVDKPENLLQAIDSALAGG